MKAIATDLDRTLFPNGKAEYEEGSMEEFSKLIKKNKLYLIYITGRYKSLVDEGIKEHEAPTPDYIVCNVGTEIYEKSKEEFILDREWKKHIKKDWKGYDSKKVKEILKEVRGIQEQEDIKQSDVKQSYYIKEKNKETIEEINNRLKKSGLESEVVYSYDTEDEVGLIDILPKSSTKLGALNYLSEKIKLDKDNIIYSGDSGNDYLPLTAGFKGILVNNAPLELKEELKEKVYISNKNYVAGIIEGAKHYGFFK